jgi:predicted 2-oxoglutarate/Fe(II)-dependent dioxygenase YbiX
MKFNYWYWNNVLSNENIKELNNIIENNFDFYENEEFTAKEKNQTLKNVTTKQIYFFKIKKFLNKIMYDIYNTNNQNFNYNINEIKNYDLINFNTYQSLNKQEYKYHVDATLDPYEDIKLTIVINLSETIYEGGDFFIFSQGEQEIKEIKTPGNMIIFKSFLNHKVSPVTAGERKTLTFFLKGPSFR